MNREAHVRNCEGVGVKLPRATRLWQSHPVNMNLGTESLTLFSGAGRDGIPLKASRPSTPL
jgi:hypothetical protein